MSNFIGAHITVILSQIMADWVDLYIGNIIQPDSLNAVLPELLKRHQQTMIWQHILGASWGVMKQELLKFIIVLLLLR